MTLVQVAFKKLTMSQECWSGQLELGPPWVPLTQSVTAIEICRENLQRLSAWNDKETTLNTLTSDAGRKKIFKVINNVSTMMTCV